MFRNYPELYMMDLHVRIMNDLTFNLKRNVAVTDEKFGWTREEQADKQSQTEDGQLAERRQDVLGCQHGGSVVKFLFDNEGAALKSPNLSTKSFTMGNGIERTNKTILKKHTTYSTQENITSAVLERSHSLTDSNIPLLEKKQTWEQASRLSKFRERFSTKKAASEDICSRNFVLDIPEIILNSPEDDNGH